MFSGKMLSRNLLPACRARGGRDGLDGDGKRDSGPGLREVDGDGAQNQADGGNNLKEDDRLERHAAHTAQFVMSRDAGDDAAKDERRDNHANEAQENVSEEVGLRCDGGRVHTQFCAGEHGEEGPHQQRATAYGKGKKEAERGPAKDGGKLGVRVKKAGCDARGKEQDGGESERAKDRLAGLRNTRRGSGSRG